MKKVLTIVLSILSLSLAAAQTTRKTSPQGSPVVLKESKTTIITQPQIPEWKQKQELLKKELERQQEFLENLKALPVELQEDVLFYKVLEQLEAGIIDFSTAKPLEARRFARQIEQLLRMTIQSGSAKAQLLIKTLVQKRQLIGLLDEIDYNRLPSELRTMLDQGIDEEVEAGGEQELVHLIESIKNPQIFDKIRIKFLGDLKNYKALSGYLVTTIYDHASRNPHPQIIEYLVSKQGIDSTTLFKKAVEENKNPEVLIRLKELGATIDPASLCDAVSKNRNKKIITTLLSFGLGQSKTCGDDFTPLYRAATHMNTVAVEELINSGADVNAEYYGKTPLIGLFSFYHSCLNIEYQDQVEAIARLLLQHGASTKGVRAAIKRYLSYDPVLKDKFLALIKPYERKSIWQFWR